MQGIFIQYVFLVLIILALVMLANKIKVAYPIVLVLGGLVLSFTVRFSNITINPDAVFFIFLPPLLYEAAWQTSWKEFWKWRRVITSFAFPIVILTSCIVAFATNAFIPGFTLALGFLLGGIVSPPDAVSATTIMRGVKVPKSMVAITEGESLLNDASSLIVFRFALAAVLTGQFHLGQAAGTFFLVVFMGIAIGLLVGLIIYAIYRLLPTTSSIEVALTLITPYCMYHAAEHFHFSGVLAVVSGGLLLSSKRQSMLSYRSRIEGVNVWTNLVFVLNGFIFLLIGLQLPSITKQLGNVSFSEALFYGLAVSLILIVSRLICTYGAAIFTRIMSHFITVADPNPGWKAPLIFGWAGMRGVVSLAAALSIPVTINGGQPFPYRNLILFISFIVILETLVFQGLTLPWIISKIKMEDDGGNLAKGKQALALRHKMMEASIQYLEDKYREEKLQNKQLQYLLQRLKADLDFYKQETSEAFNNYETALNYQKMYLEMLHFQRTKLDEWNGIEAFDDAVIRKYAALIDIEEYKVREKLLEASEPE